MSSVCYHLNHTGTGVKPGVPDLVVGGGCSIHTMELLSQQTGCTWLFCECTQFQYWSDL